MSIWAYSLKPYQLIFIWALLKPWFCFNPKFTSIWAYSLNPNYLILGASRLLHPVLERSSTLCLERTLLAGHDVEGRMEMGGWSTLFSKAYELVKHCDRGICDKMTRAFSLLMSLTRRHSARSSSSFVSRNCCHRRGFASVIAPEVDNNVVHRMVASSSSSSKHNNNVGAGFHGNNDNGRGQHQRFRNPRKVVQQSPEGEEASSSSSSSAPPPHVFWSSDFCDHRGMQVVFLGTSSSMPTISRNTSCIALRLGMYPWAFVSMNFASSIFRILGFRGFFFIFFFSVLGSFFRFVFGGW